MKIEVDYLGNSLTLLSEESVSNSVIKETKESNFVTSPSNDNQVRLDVDFELVKKINTQSIMESSFNNGSQFDEQFKLVPNFYHNL